MNVPENLRYSSDHEWVVADGDNFRVGITDYAQDALGDVVFVELPEVGGKLEAGTSFGEIESTKSVSDLFAPLSGSVLQVNDALVANPELINSDPYGDGWICVIAADAPDALDALLDAEAYLALTGD